MNILGDLTPGEDEDLMAFERAMLLKKEMLLSNRNKSMDDFIIKPK
jgi:hypothetical protein